MGVGLGGAYGQIVPNPVNLEHKLGHGAARNHRLNMAGERVQERLVVNEFATHSLVQVCSLIDTYFFSYQ